MSEHEIDPHNMDAGPTYDDSDTFDPRHPLHGDRTVMTIALGDDCAAFMNSNVGMYLQGRSEEIVADCQAKLLTVDPDDRKAIRDLQHKAAVATEALQWLLQAALDGEAEYNARYKETPDA